MTGLIPAHAGNTYGCCGLKPLRWAHPRACGEHAVIYAYNNIGWGSSPRMRGTLACSVSHYLTARLIPAHAGNTPRTT